MKRAHNQINAQTRKNIITDRTHWWTCQNRGKDSSASGQNLYFANCTMCVFVLFFSWYFERDSDIRSSDNWSSNGKISANAISRKKQSLNTVNVNETQITERTRTMYSELMYYELCRNNSYAHECRACVQWLLYLLGKRSSIPTSHLLRGPLYNQMIFLYTDF